MTMTRWDVQGKKRKPGFWLEQYVSGVWFTVAGTIRELELEKADQESEMSVICGVRQVREAARYTMVEAEERTELET